MNATVSWLSSAPMWQLFLSCLIAVGLGYLWVNFIDYLSSKKDKNHPPDTNFNVEPSLQYAYATDG